MAYPETYVDQAVFILLFPTMEAFLYYTQQFLNPSYPFKHFPSVFCSCKLSRHSVNDLFLIGLTLFN